MQAQLTHWLTGHCSLWSVGVKSEFKSEMDGDSASSTEGSFRVTMDKGQKNDILVDFQTGVTSQCWSV